MDESMRLLTQKDLAERWQVSVKTIERYREDKVITPCKRLLPTIRFTLQHIEEIEGVELERFSPLERRKMEKEIEKLRKENAELKKCVAKILSLTAELHGIIGNDMGQ